MTIDEREVASLRSRVVDLQQALEAVRDGAVDALVGAQADPQLYALVSADRPYRVLIEKMGQGAATATAGGVVLFGNQQLAGLLDVDRDKLIGRDLASFVHEPSRAELARLLAVELDDTRRAELALVSPTLAGPVPALVAVTALEIDGEQLRCLVVTDLTKQKELERRQAEEALREEQRAERNLIAREVNDSIVQGLVAAEMALDLGDVQLARETVARTSAHARAWIGELVENDRLEAGMAVRTAPAQPGQGR